MLKKMMEDDEGLIGSLKERRGSGFMEGVVCRLAKVGPTLGEH